MKKCSNCATLNDDFVERCCHCNIKSKFKSQPVETPGSLPEAPSPDLANRCRNCGEAIQPAHQNCPVCQMPQQKTGRLDRHFSPSANGKWLAQKLFCQPCPQPLN